MPKNRSTTILRRWQAMDAALGTSGLYVGDFARRCRVSEKTVYRDLEAFRELGQRTACVRDEGGRYYWEYEGGVEWLFVNNVPRPLKPSERPKGTGAGGGLFG